MVRILEFLNYNLKKTTLLHEYFCCPNYFFLLSENISLVHLLLTENNSPPSMSLVFWEYFPSLVPELVLPVQSMANPTLQFIDTHQIVLQAKLVTELLGLWITAYFAIFYHPESLFL